MSGKADFTDDEWATLLRAPIIAGMAITFADPGGPIGVVKETSAVLKVVQGSSMVTFAGSNDCKLSKGLASRQEVSTGGGSSCSHSICATGTKLTSSCDSCAADICSQDSYCCTTKWDSQCVSEVSSICSESCN